MGEPRFNKNKRYVNKSGQKFGKGVWYDEKGNMIKPGQGVYNNHTKKVTQYNSDGSISIFTREQWHKKRTKDRETQIIQNDRKWAIPYIPEKQMTVTIDPNSPTSRNRGATFSENVLDSIAVNAQRAGIPFSTGLALASTESTIGSNKSRMAGKGLLPWLYALNQDKSSYGNYARRISYDGMYSPTALISDWAQSMEDNPFSAFEYTSKGELRKFPQDEEYYRENFEPMLRKDNRNPFDNKSPLQHGFEKYKKNPYKYNGGDPTYPDKVEANRQELVNYSPEIREYMRKNNLHGEGGPLTLNKTWDNLSLAEKAEMMRVAINNGMLTLPEIKDAYNEFAQGGPLTGWTKKDEAGYRHWRNNLPKNLRDTNDTDYDMRAAYKAGMQPEWHPEDNSYHLGSRDPKTGRILKAPHHPTFLQALVTDAGMGYYPTTDKDGNTYTETWKGNEEVQDMLSNLHAEGGNQFGMGGPEDARYKHATTLYKGYVDAGVNPQAALELVNQQVAEKGWNTWASGDNRKFNNADDFIKHTVDYHTRMYPDTLNADNFTQFFKGLEFGKHRYNPNVQKYKKDLLLTRPGVKKRINKYRSTLGQQPLAFVDSPYFNYPSEDNVVPISDTLLIDPSLIEQENITALGGNLYKGGGYAPSKKLQSDIATWEGTEMQRNAPFSEVTKQFNAVIPKNIQARLSTDQLDALYSYGYNVGMGNLKKRVVPTLNAYVNNKASREDVQRSMWASKDNELRGLTRRRNWERAKFGGGYRTTFTGNGGNPNNNGRITLGLQTDPASYGIPDTFFDDFTKQIYTVPSPSVQYADSMQTDPSTVYTPPVIPDTQQSVPEIKEEEPVYNPKQDKLEGLRRMSTIMDMMGQSNPLSGFLGAAASDNSPMGIMALVNGIYGK